MASKITTDQQNQIIALYSEGKTLQAVADTLGLSREGVAKILRRNNVEIWDKRVVHPRDYDKVMAMYSDGHTLVSIAAELGVGRESVAKTLKKFKVPIQNGNSRVASFGVDKNYFEKDTEGAAYFFGLLLSDGNISDRGKVSISLQSEDSHILEDMKQALNSNSTVNFQTRKTGESYCQLCFTVKELSESLYKLGMTPRKSLEEQAPEKFLNNRNFWRGMVDGDGSVGFWEGKSSRVYLCGSQKVCEQFLDYTKTIVPEITTKVVLSKGDLYRVTISGIKAAQVLKELYKDSTYKLQRKFNKSLQIFEKYGIHYD